MKTGCNPPSLVPISSMYMEGAQSAPRQPGVVESFRKQFEMMVYLSTELSRSHCGDWRGEWIRDGIRWEAETQGGCRAGGAEMD